MEKGNYPLKASGYRLGGEVLPMTMQVGLVGGDEIVIASDTKVWSDPADIGRTITSFVQDTDRSARATGGYMRIGDECSLPCG